MPSILDSCTTRAFLDLPRERYKLNSSSFRTAFQRILRLPIHNTSSCRHCKCEKKTLIDIFGDHYVDCTSTYSRTQWHHGLRDSLYGIMKVCSSDAGVTHSDKDVMHEPTGLVRGQENKRPGDVVLILNRNYSDPHRLSR